MSLDLYPQPCYEGDLSPDSFGAEVDDICNEIHKACAGFGTDESKLIKVLGSCTPDQRCKIPIRYKEMFGKELQKIIKSECGNKDFGTALQFLAVDPVEAECDMIDKAIQGFGTNELLLLTIICGRSNKDIDLLKKHYFKINTKDLGRVIDNDIGGTLEAIIFNVFQGCEEVYDPDHHTEDKMKSDVEMLYNMGQGKWGTNEKGLFKLICASPPEYLKKLNLKYADKYGYTLQKVLEKELGGCTEKAATFMIGMKLKPYEEVAKLINDACRGFGTNELMLTCVLIRYQLIMKEVFTAYAELYGKTILETIEKESGGDYGKLLMKIAETTVIKL